MATAAYLPAEDLVVYAFDSSIFVSVKHPSHKGIKERLLEGRVSVKEIYSHGLRVINEEDCCSVTPPPKPPVTVRHDIVTVHPV